MVDDVAAEEEVEEDDGEEGERLECAGCGRKFKPESLQRHKKICKKVFQSKRKTFDMKKQRIIDGEHMEIMKNKEFQEKKAKAKQKEADEAKKKAKVNFLTKFFRKSGKNSQKILEEC